MKSIIRKPAWLPLVFSLGFLVSAYTPTDGQMPAEPNKASAKAESRMLQPSSALPPEIRKAREEASRASSGSRVRPTTAQLKQKLMALPGGPGKVERAASGKMTSPLRPSGGADPQLQEIEKLPAHAGTRQRLNKEQLMEKLLGMPGKRELIETIRQRKSTGWVRGAESLLSMLNPFGVTNAEAQTPSGGSSSIALAASATLPWSADANNGWRVANPSEPWNPRLHVDFVETTVVNCLAEEVVRLSGVTGTNSYAFIAVNIPADGFYILDIVASLIGAGAELEHYDGFSYVSVEEWPYVFFSFDEDFVTLVELARGLHCFRWRPVESGSAYFIEVTVAAAEF